MTETTGVTDAALDNIFASMHNLSLPQLEAVKFYIYSIQEKNKQKEPDHE